MVNVAALALPVPSVEVVRPRLELAIPTPYWSYAVPVTVFVAPAPTVVADT